MRPLGLGYLPDLHDPRDRPAVAGLSLGGVPPESSNSLDRWVYEIPNQGAAEACVGFAVAQGIRVRHAAVRQAAGQSGGPDAVPHPSAAWIWWLARHSHGQELHNSPTYLRQAFARVRAIGIVDESVCPSDDLAHRYAIRPTPLAVRAGFDHRCPTAYYRIPTDDPPLLQALVQLAISSGYPVAFGTPVPESFMGWSGTSPFDDLDAPAIGGHAMVATSYDREGLRGPNSWGREWGADGWFALSWRYAAERFGDCWAIDLEGVQL